MVRQGLVNHRNVASQRDLNDMLWIKWQNPIFGIYGAHLLLLSPEPNIALLEKVTHNLDSLLGDHPDVRALAIYLADRKNNQYDFTAYTAPPMLRSSWNIIVNATVLKPELVPSTSLAAQISDRLWGYSPWLIWQNPVEIKVVDVLPPFPLEAIGDVSIMVGKVTTNGVESQKVAERANLTPIEHDLLDYIFDMVRPDAPSDEVAKLLSALGKTFKLRQPSSTDERLSSKGVVRSLGVPASVASTALEGLTSKLGLSPQN